MSSRINRHLAFFCEGFFLHLSLITHIYDHFYFNSLEVTKNLYIAPTLFFLPGWSSNHDPICLKIESDYFSFGALKSILVVQMHIKSYKFRCMCNVHALSWALKMACICHMYNIKIPITSMFWSKSMLFLMCTWTL